MNKYQESLKWIKNDIERSVSTETYFRKAHENIGILQELIDNQDKYRWHDLRKDPNDLPKVNGFYMVKVGAKFYSYRVFKYEPSNYGYGLDIPKQNLWKWENGDYVYNLFVEAWKYIEEFKDE